MHTLHTLVSRIPVRTWLLLIALAFLLVLIAEGYIYDWQWTGFPQKKLFDWIQILVIPVAVAIATFVLNREAKRRDDEAQRAREQENEKAQQEQREREEAIEVRREEEAALQAYLNYISQMLTDPHRPLRRSHLGDNLSVVARAQTLTVLQKLGAERKRSALQFLYESGLIARQRVVSLVDADLSGANLSEVILSEAYLSGAYLRGAYLRRAYLSEVILSEVVLSEANLSQANLSGANLSGANLRTANLREAFLSGADLSGADLSGANLSEAYLGDADLSEAFLSGADLSGVNLSGVNLSGTYLGDADLREANLSGADLRKANLSGAGLSGANLGEARNLVREQIEEAAGDEAAQLPPHLKAPAAWSVKPDDSSHGDE